MWWLVALLSFLSLELVLRTKLGTIFVIVALWSLAHQALEEKMGGARAEAVTRFLFAVYAALVICAFIFAVFSVLNISLRSIDNSWNWFQLP
jgi:uncharacterized membrane protein